MLPIRPLRPLPLLAAALLAAGVPGCSADAADDRTNRSEEQPSAGYAVADAADTPGCELLTSEEIGAATGEEPARAEWNDRHLRGCSWYRADRRPLLGLVIGAAPATYDEYIANLREQADESGSLLEDVDTSSVPGVGDYAIWHESPGASYLNAAREGDLFVLTIFRDPTSAKSKREAVLELARAGMPRM